MAQCVGTAKSSGERCRLQAIPGGVVCRRYHGGSAPQTQAKAAVRAELMRWTLGDPVDDPGETLLRLITQSRMRADLYGDLLERAYDAAERLTDNETDLLVEPDNDVERARVQQARQDLDHVFNVGGVAALVGKTYGAAGKDGDIFATGEAIRGLALLESQERERCAKFCTLAISAGLAERMVRIHEKQAAQAFQAFTDSLKESSLSDTQRREVEAGYARHLRVVAS